MLVNTTNRQIIKKTEKKTYSHDISIIIFKKCNTNEIYCIITTRLYFYINLKKMLQIHDIKLLILNKFEMGYDLFHPDRIIFIFDKIQNNTRK